MQTYYGVIQKNNTMSIGGEATRFVLTGKNDVSMEIEGDKALLQNNLGRWVNLSGDWQEVGVENKRQVFFVQKLSL
jgi:hypothetical protein